MIARVLLFLSALLIPLFIGGCAFFSSDDGSYKSESYIVKFQAPQWSTINAESSDYAFVNKETRSIIITNSLCRKYESATLKNLTTNILSGLQDLNIEESKEVSYSDREAIRTLAHGQMDGVKVYLMLQTVRKNRCIYDFALIATSKALREQDQRSFFDFLNSVEIK